MAPSLHTPSSSISTSIPLVSPTKRRRMSGGNEHLALPAYTRLDGSHSPHIAPPSAYRDSQRQVGRTAVGWRRLAARPVVFLPCIALALVAGLTWHRAGSAEGRGERGVSGRLQDSFDRLAAGWSKGSFGSSGKQLDLEWVCNPFEANGRLVVDEADPTKNVWVPFDSRCRPSNLMTALYRPPGDTAPIIPPRPTSRQAGRTFLPWLMNRTVVLHGDSIDRFHLKDFCEFVGGRLELITPDHPACPPMWRDPRGDAERKRLEDQWAGRPREGWELTNPWVCDIEEYGATLVNVFTWGLEGAEEFFQTERWYYPPGARALPSSVLAEADSLFCSPLDGPAGPYHAPTALGPRQVTRPAANRAP